MKGRSSAPSLQEGQSSVDLILTNVASPLCPATKTNLKLLQVDMGTPDRRDCPQQVDSVAFKGNWKVLQTTAP